MGSIVARWARVSSLVMSFKRSQNGPRSAAPQSSHGCYRANLDRGVGAGKAQIPVRAPVAEKSPPAAGAINGMCRAQEIQFTVRQIEQTAHGNLACTINYRTGCIPSASASGLYMKPKLQRSSDEERRDEED